MTTIQILYVFGTIGILDTLYLIYHKLAGTDVTCPFFPKAWCHKVQHSPQSKTLGIPNSYAGFAMYVIILWLTAQYTAGTVAFWPIQAVVTFGFLFSMYFLYVQAFVLRAFCTWCVVSAINFTVMMLAVWAII
jgi:uncharacterized membrane protein